MDHIDISIIYVYFNTPHEILNSLRSIPNAVGKRIYEVIIVNNNSPRPLPREIRKIKYVSVQNNRINKGYGTGINQAAKQARGKYLLIVNTDTVFHENTILMLYDRLKKDKRIGVISPQMIDKGGELLPTISGFPTLPAGVIIYSFINKLFPKNPISSRFWLYKIDRSREQFVDVVSGACLLISKDLFVKIHGFDEQFFLYFEEHDLCFRVKKLGYKALYYPQAVITHLVGKSLQDTEKIKKYFEKSRFLFFKKYHGFFAALFSEIFLRYVTPFGISLFLILGVSTFMNLYRLDTLMLFIGDAARDFLAARNMLLTGNVPLVGIPSSVVWLHQGPLSVYLIGLALYIGKFHPVAPAVLFGLINVFATYLVYQLGKTFFDKQTGLFAALFYATSPLIVVNARMPYHTALIPVISSFLLLLLHQASKESKWHLMLLFFVFGLLLQVELSNIVIGIVLFIVLFKKRISMSKDRIIYSCLGFFLGVFPFILYDITNRFVYLVGFPLWIANRMRLFFGLTLDNNATTQNFPNALHTIFQQLSAILFPTSPVGVIVIIGMCIFILLRYRRIFFSKDISPLTILLFWLIIPITAFFFHTSPGPAYFPVIYPVIALFIGFAISRLIVNFRLATLFFVAVVITNSWMLLAHDFFSSTLTQIRGMPPNNYNFGSSWKNVEYVSDGIIADAKGRPMQLQPKGSFAQFPTSIDSYKYIILWKQGKVDNKSNLRYVFLPDLSLKEPDGKIILQGTHIPYIVRYD